MSADVKYRNGGWSRSRSRAFAGTSDYNTHKILICLIKTRAQFLLHKTLLIPRALLIAVSPRHGSLYLSDKLSLSLSSASSQAAITLPSFSN